MAVCWWKKLFLPVSSIVKVKPLFSLLDYPRLRCSDYTAASYCRYLHHDKSKMKVDNQALMSWNIFSVLQLYRQLNKVNGFLVSSLSGLLFQCKVLGEPNSSMLLSISSWPRMRLMFQGRYMMLAMLLMSQWASCQRLCKRSLDPLIRHCAFVTHEKRSGSY